MKMAHLILKNYKIMYPNKLQISIFKFFRFINLGLIKGYRLNKPDCISDPDLASEIIYDLLISNKPVMIARFGSTELACLQNYLGVKSPTHSWSQYILGSQDAWWWNPKIISQMKEWSGFFPSNIISIEKFCEIMIKNIPEVDLLGSWLASESLFKAELSKSIKVDFELLNPYFSNTPWTRALSGKRVLVIHPFAQTIESQFKKRELLFNNQLLPDFELLTIEAVQSIGGQPTPFPDWFAALDSMKLAMDKIDYEICLIGCGAYGFPLAAHAKSQGKKGFQLGGALQLLFGIKGGRWDNPNYSFSVGNHKDLNYWSLSNEHWVRPSRVEIPNNYKKIENGCYW